MASLSWRSLVLLVAAAVAVSPWCSASAALALGLFVALAIGNPHMNFTGPLTRPMLQWGVVGLGAGMNLNAVLKVGAQGFAYTAIGIAATFFLGDILRRLLRVSGDEGTLITVGTAICGGSAIAAVAPVIRARPAQVSVSLATVFILNAVALWMFPPIGRFASLNETQFGLWSALAIHDTSSVVGASMQYGEHALSVATSAKLARALWIVPLTLIIFALRKRRHQNEGQVKTAWPWFILGFLGLAALITFVPALGGAGKNIEFFARRLLVLTLFLIGVNLKWQTVREMGVRPFILGVLLWFVVASGTLLAIKSGLV